MKCFTEFHPWPTGEAGTHPSHLPTSLTQKTTSVRFHSNSFSALQCQCGLLGPATVGHCQRLCVGQWLEPLTSPSIQPRVEPARGVSSPCLPLLVSPSLSVDHLVPQGTFTRWPSSLSHTFQILYPLQPPWFFLKFYLIVFLIMSVCK